MAEKPRPPGFAGVALVEELGVLVRAMVFKLKLVWRLFWDGLVRIRYKLIPIGVMGYWISPVDLIPEVVPVFGVLDDAAVIVGGLSWFVRKCPPEVVAKHIEALLAKLKNKQGDNDPNVVDGNVREV